ncbi:MAG: tripartite tricarboxylate transporter TctB family protein [Burkholderiales bacterium]
MLGRDGIAALVIFAASAGLYALTLGLHDNPLVPIGPAFYPRIVIGTTAALALWVLVADVLARRRRLPAAAAAAGRPNYALVLASFLAFGAYVIALPYLGFRVATLAYVAGAAALLARPRGARGWLKVLVLAVLTAFVTYFAFEHYLLVLLPRGRWTGF